jgi:hypothetical protein
VFVVFDAVVMETFRDLSLLYFHIPFIIKDANVVSSIICVLGLHMMCLMEVHLKSCMQIVCEKLSINS